MNLIKTYNISKMFKGYSSFVFFYIYRLYFAKHETRKRVRQMERIVGKNSQQPPEIQFQGWYSQISFEGRDVG